MRKKTTTLYFTEGSNLSDEEAAEMELLPGSRQRNASLVGPDAPLEKCDFVAGPAIPENYAEKYPLAKKVQVVEEEEEETDDPEQMTVAQLKNALDEAKVEYLASAKKADLIVLYQENISK